MSKLFLAILFSIIICCITWSVNFGQFKWKYIYENPIKISLLAAPVVSILAIYSSRYYKESFSTNWPGLIIAGSIKLIIYAYLTTTYLNDKPQNITILLAIAIIVTQMYSVSNAKLIN
jgi:hypothetical protein